MMKSGPKKRWLGGPGRRLGFSQMDVLNDDG